jgi:hypothetical protein
MDQSCHAFISFKIVSHYLSEWEEGQGDIEMGHDEVIYETVNWLLTRRSMTMSLRR